MEGRSHVLSTWYYAYICCRVLLSSFAVEFCCRVLPSVPGMFAMFGSYMRMSLCVCLHQCYVCA